MSVIYTEVIFDIETKKIFDDIKGDNPADLGISIVSVYKRKVDEKGAETEGEMSSFGRKIWLKCGRFLATLTGLSVSTHFILTCRRWCRFVLMTLKTKTF